MAEFDGIVGTITVNKNILSVDKQYVAGQFSANLVYNVNFADDFWNGFDVLEWYAAGSYVEQTELCKYDMSKKMLTIPYGGFVKDGNLYVSVRGIKGDIKYASNILVLIVGQNVNVEDNDVVADPSWMDKVTQIIDNVFITKYDPQYEALVKKVDEQIDENARLITKANEQQQQIDNAIDVMGDYEIVNEDPTQIRFKKGNGEFGDTVDLGDGLASKNMVNAGYYLQKGKTYNGPASDYGIYVAQIEGAYEQDITNGYQLFDASKLQTTSMGGATVTNNGDGSFTVSGSGNLTNDFSNIISLTHEETIKLFKVGTLKAKKDNILPYAVITFRNSNGYVGEANTSNILSFEITKEMLSDSSFICFVGFYSVSNKTIATGTIKPMFYQDGDGTWEKFTGGEPAPNPNYPQEPRFNKIRKFISSGRNLLPKPTFETKQLNGVTFTNNNDGTIYLKGTATNTSSIYVLENLVIPNGDYTLSVTGKDVIVYITINNKRIGGSSNVANFVIEEGDIINNVGIGVSSGKTYNLIVSPQIEFGNVATEYVPYQGLIETPTYHNLFNISGELNQAKDGNQSGANLNTIEGNVLVAGVNSSMVDCQGQKLVNDLTGKKISVGVNITSLGTGTKGKVMIYDNGELGYGFEQGLGYYSIDGYTCKSDNVVIAFGTVDGEKAKFEDIIVNIGEEAEEWVPYEYTDKPQGVLELRALPDGTRDKHVMTFKEMGMNLLSVAKVTFDGSDDENWTIYSGVSKETYTFKIDILNKPTGYNNAFCNKLKYLNACWEKNDEWCCSTFSVGRGFYVNTNTTISTVEQFKTWLSQNPIGVYYELDTQANEEYNLYMIPSFYDYTNVWTDSDVEPNMVEWHANTYAGRNQELGNELIRIEDVSAFKDAVSVGNTTSRTVLKTVDDDYIYMYTESKGARALAVKDETAEIARISISQDLEYTEENEGNINLVFEKPYPDGFGPENCMVVGVSELDNDTGKRIVASFTTVELDPKQVVRIFYNTTIGGPKTIQLDVVLMKLPSIL